MKPLLILTLLMGMTYGDPTAYPFEKEHRIPYRKIRKWTADKKTPEKCGYTAILPHYFPGGDALKVHIISPAHSDTSLLELYRGNRPFQQFREAFSLEPINDPDSPPDLISWRKPTKAYIEDINGDGLDDLKILIPNNGCCGAYNYYAQVIYLFQRKDGSFTKVSFQDMFMNDENRPERDMDGDGKYEIITRTFVSYSKHNYWAFNLYDFDGSGLVNVNAKAGYPILVQLLNRENFAVTTHMSREKMKSFARALPDDYNAATSR